MMSLASLDPRGQPPACLRCCYFRRKQRLLAFLTASTGISFILLLLHTPSSTLLPNKGGLLTAEKELPERSHYVKKDVHLLGEPKKENVIHGQVLTPAVYRNKYYGRKKEHNDKKQIKTESINRDILKHYKSGSDIVHIEYFKRPPRQKQKSFERKLNLLELRNYKAFPGGGGRDGDEEEEGEEEEKWQKWENRPKEEVGNDGGGNREPFEVLPESFQKNIDSIGKVKPIKPFKNTSQELLKPSHPSPSPSSVALSQRGNNQGGKDNDNDEEEDEVEELNSMIVVYDYKRPVYFPWRTTRDECANYATRFMVAGGAPLIAAVSFPGAGNTWLRYVSETLTGIFTGSVYHDEALALKGFWGERDGYRQGTTLLQKTHSFPLLPHEVKDGIYNGKEFRFLVPHEPRKVVILLRNPWESLLALRHYHAAGHTGFANTAFFKGPEWANFTSERAQLWVQLYTSWLSLPHTKLHVVHYEHLKHGMEKEAKRLIKFLGLPLDYGRLECLMRYPEGRFRRPKYPKHLQGYRFPSASVNILKEGMGSVDSLLRQGGHPSLPTHLYSFTPPIQEDPSIIPEG